MDWCSFALGPVLENEKRKKKPFPTSIIEIIRKSGPFNKTEIFESELENNFKPVHSKDIQNVLRRKLSHDPTFGVYQGDTGCYFKIGLSSLKYNDENVFVDGRMYKATQGLWELLTKPTPDKLWSFFKRNRHINK
jgi:hypothetical protein